MGVTNIAGGLKIENQYKTAGVITLLLVYTLIFRMMVLVHKVRSQTGSATVGSSTAGISDGNEIFPCSFGCEPESYDNLLSVVKRIFFHQIRV